MPDRGRNARSSVRLPRAACRIPSWRPDRDPAGRPAFHGRGCRCRAPVIRAATRSSAGGEQVAAREEERGFLRGVLSGVGRMDGVAFLGFGKEGADGACGGLGRVGRSDGLAERGHGIIALQQHGYAGPGRHERDERTVEGACAMDGVELASLFPGKAKHPHGADTESGVLEVG